MLSNKILRQFAGIFRSVSKCDVYVVLDLSCSVETQLRPKFFNFSVQQSLFFPLIQEV